MSAWVFWITAALLVVIVVSGSIILSKILLRRSSDKGLLGLALVACVAALFFAPLYRSAPERVAMNIFVAGLGPLLVILIAPLVASIVRFVRTHRIWPGLSLVMSVGAVALFVINLFTAWIWPFATY